MFVIDIYSGILILLGVLCLLSAYLFYRTRQTRGWARLDAVVVEHVNDWLEGYSYDLRVVYEHENQRYTAVALNWFFVSEKRKIGESIKVLVNPQEPTTCVFYY